MAFEKSNLSLVNYSGNGFHFWHYTTTDAAAAVDTAGYFNDAATEMNLGDLIMITTASGGTPVYGLMVVNANSGTVVDVADMVSLSGSDSD